MFFISTTALLIIGAAALLGTIGGIIGNHIANEKGATGWEKVGYIFGGVVIGATIGVVAGLIAAPAVISATGIAGISVTAAGITAVTTSAGLVIPEYVNNASSFINWARGMFEKTKQVIDLQQIKQLFDVAKQYGVKITADAADLAGHIGTAWDIAHIHLGNARVHIAVTKEVIKWIIKQLG